MDDDDFGGFEAAESYEYGNGEKQTTSPAISWAAFPTVSEVHISQNVSPDVLLEHSVPSSCLVPPDSFTLSNDNVATAIQTANVINPAVLKEQNQVDIQVASLNLNEDISLVTSAVGTDDNETKRKNELKSCLQQTVANLETKLCTAEEEKIKTKKELEYLLEKNSILEMNFLKEKKEKLLKYQDRYKMIQEKHKQELEDMRQAGHEALSIIVEEFKALLQSTVQQQEAAIEKQYILAIEKQSHKCEELLNAQEIVKEALMEEQKRSEKAIEEAVKRTREELVEYIKEQKRCEFYKEFQGTFTFVCSCVQCNYVTDFMELDQVVRQRNLSSLELFLSCAQKQLGILLNEDPTATEEKRD
ncbi:coiled-coil domain-containing protein 91 isoform X6 [Cygnus atratus]|uniref:coiled-coil domain-containing protein 91 isoform X6 n=1 Tax=Cygnus atratus TaxID=8868 RepID=UPI0021B72F3B|nr:coiled-coil domain-containing protein 91 isoform X6 [Cygnus atratus]